MARDGVMALRRQRSLLFLVNICFDLGMSGAFMISFIFLVGEGTWWGEQQTSDSL
jgi:hypothetical protein